MTKHAAPVIAVPCGQLSGRCIAELRAAGYIVVEAADANDVRLVSASGDAAEVAGRVALGVLRDITGVHDSSAIRDYFARCLLAAIAGGR